MPCSLSQPGLCGERGRLPPWPVRYTCGLQPSSVCLWHVNVVSDPGAQRHIHRAARRVYTAPPSRMAPHFAPKGIGVGPERRTVLPERGEICLPCLETVVNLRQLQYFHIILADRWRPQGEKRNAPPTRLKAAMHEENYCLRDEEAERGQFGGCRLLGRFRIGSSLTFRNITLPASMAKTAWPFGRRRHARSRLMMLLPCGMEWRWSGDAADGVFRSILHITSRSRTPGGASISTDNLSEINLHGWAENV